MHYLVNTYEIAKILLLVEMRKPRHREGEQLAQALADKWWGQVQTQNGWLQSLCY